MRQCDGRMAVLENVIISWGITLLHVNLGRADTVRGDAPYGIHAAPPAGGVDGEVAWVERHHIGRLCTGSPRQPYRKEKEKEFSHNYKLFRLISLKI